MDGLGFLTNEEGSYAIQMVEFAARDNLPYAAAKGEPLGGVSFGKNVNGYAGQPDITSPDGRALYVVVSGSLIRFDTSTKASSTLREKVGGENVVALAASHRGVVFQTAKQQGGQDVYQFYYLDAHNRKTRELIGIPSKANTAAFDLDGRTLAVLCPSEAGDFYLCDIETGACKPIPNVYTGWSSDSLYYVWLGFSPDGRYIVAVNSLGYSSSTFQIMRVSCGYPYDPRLSEYTASANSNIDSYRAPFCWVGNSLLLAHRLDTPYGAIRFLRYDATTHRCFELPFTLEAGVVVGGIAGLRYDAVRQRVIAALYAHEGLGKPPRHFWCFELAQWNGEGSLQAVFDNNIANNTSYSPVMCQYDMGYIAGKVLDKDGKPAARAVQAFSREDGRLVAQTLSAASDGRYHLNVPFLRGVYDVWFRALDSEDLSDLLVSRVRPRRLADTPPFAQWPSEASQPPIAGQVLPLPASPKQNPPPAPPPPKVPPKPRNPPVVSRLPPKPQDIPSKRIFADQNDVVNGRADHIGQPGWLHHLWYYSWGHWQHNYIIWWD